MRRRGQLFSLDAMLAFVLVVIMFGTVTATSESLRNEVTSMVGWYERANIADNMLDVLTKSPGEPPNWTDNPSGVLSIGLADNRTGGVSYVKMDALVKAVRNNVPAVRNILTNMSANKNFELLFFLGKWSFEVNLSNTTGSIPLNVTNVTVNYEFPTNASGSLSSGLITGLSPSFYRVIVKIGSDLTTTPNLSQLLASRDNATWVEFSERRTTLSLLNYSRTVNITPSGVQNVLAGTLMMSLPPYLLLKFEVPNETGYVIFVVRDGNSTKVLGVWHRNGLAGAALWEKVTDGVRLLKSWNGSQNSVEIPWAELFSAFDPDKGGKVVEMWVYGGTLSYVVLQDTGGIGGFLEPVEEPLVIKLWVWDGP
ncbi:hypothetical protein [Thermococcus sp.]